MPPLGADLYLPCPPVGRVPPRGAPSPIAFNFPNSPSANLATGLGPARPGTSISCPKFGIGPRRGLIQAEKADRSFPRRPLTSAQQCPQWINPLHRSIRMARSTSKDSSTNPGFEAKLWLAADKLADQHGRRRRRRFIRGKDRASSPQFDESAKLEAAIRANLAKLDFKR